LDEKDDTIGINQIIYTRVIPSILKMEILTGLPEGIISNALYDVVKRILKKDPIRSAIDKAIDELIKEKPTDLFVLEEIDRNRKHIFNNINLTEEATFLKILTENEVLPETASRLYKKFSMKFKENIKEAALKEPEIFYPYAITEFENIKTDNKELIKLLTGFAHKNEVYLDRIIKHFKDLEKIPYIPDIQSVLRKGETTEGEFFRKEPVWVDYEQGFIVERKEVDEIIKKLENSKVQLVLGAPASGKSIILKNVGFKLANQKKVYVVELKKHPQDEIKLFFENIPKIDDDNPIFIIDDAHLNISECERLIRDFRSKGKGNLIIGSREIREITEGEEKEASEFDYLRKTVVHAEDVTEGMIKTFLETQHHFDENRIKTISANFEKYKKDLWFLSWALKSYDPKKDWLEEKEIYKKIKSDSIEKIKIGKDEKGKPIIINAENVLLPLSVFYRFEIPIERYFLEEQMGIEGNIINQLIGLQEIMEKEEIGRNKMLSLNHSSIAELYFGAYQNFPDLGRRGKKIILNGKDEENLEFCLFYQYIITTEPRNTVDVAIYLGKDWWDKKGGKTLLENLIEDDKIQKSIVKEIEKEEDIEKIGMDISLIAGTSKKVALKLADGIDINILSSKINKEKKIVKVGSCVYDISRASKEAAQELLDGIDINLLASKIDKEDDIRDVGSCVSFIAEASKEAALKLLDGIDINLLASKIDKEEDIDKVRWCISRIARLRREDALKLLESIDITALSSKIDKEEDKDKVARCLFDIAKVSEEVANEILNRHPKLKDELQKRMTYLKT
jgi:predicted transcriptional regulator